jgi:ankyrin repeat protein
MSLNRQGNIKVEPDTPLMKAVYAGNWTEVLALLEKEDVIRTINSAEKLSRYTALHLAAEAPNQEFAYEIGVALLKKGADMSLCCNNGRNSAHKAAMHGNTRLLQHFIEHGYLRDIEVTDPHNWTPFMCAVVGGRTETAKYLVSRGCNFNAMAKDNNIEFHALHQAAVKGMFRIFFRLNCLYSVDFNFELIALLVSLCFD